MTVSKFQGITTPTLQDAVWDLESRLSNDWNATPEKKQRYLERLEEMQGELERREKDDN